jgi:hypothetical protein
LLLEFEAVALLLQQVLDGPGLIAKQFDTPGNTVLPGVSNYAEQR